MATHFKIGLDSNLLLTEISTVIEKRKSRGELVSFIRTLIAPLKPTGSMINLPMYDCRLIYTTNYDTLIEQSYAIKKKTIFVHRSNFDFQLRETVGAANVYKLHGSIDQDVCDGSNFYVQDEDRALILEERGIQVCFGGLDSFFAEIAINSRHPNSSCPFPRTHSIGNRLFDQSRSTYRMPSWAQDQML